MPSRIKTLTVDEILDRCGGRVRVQNATGLGYRAIHTWVERGCPPPERWPVLVLLGDVTYDELHRLWKSTIGAGAVKNLEGFI